jgi:hypothetical protein
MFALNHGTEPALVGLRGQDVLAGEAVDGAVTLAPGGYRVVRTDATGG